MANPTTNYSWPMPTTTDLVTDLPADFAAFGQPVDTSLKALNPETTLGDISYRSSTANTKTRLAIGSTSQVLTVVGGVPAWAASAVGGKVLQVVNSTTSTSTANSTSTYADTTLTATITPTLSTSKILVFVNQSIYKGNAASTWVQIKLLRAATDLITFELRGAYNDSASQALGAGSASTTYLDSPATTSATTYKTQFMSGANVAGVTCQIAGGTSSITLMEIGA